MTNPKFEKISISSRKVYSQNLSSRQLSKNTSSKPHNMQNNLQLINFNTLTEMAHDDDVEVDDDDEENFTHCRCKGAE